MCPKLFSFEHFFGCPLAADVAVRLQKGAEQLKYTDTPLPRSRAPIHRHRYTNQRMPGGSGDGGSVSASCGLGGRAVVWKLKVIWRNGVSAHQPGWRRGRWWQRWATVAAYRRISGGRGGRLRAISLRAYQHMSVLPLVACTLVAGTELGCISPSSFIPADWAVFQTCFILAGAKRSFTKERKCADILPDGCCLCPLLPEASDLDYVVRQADYFAL